MEEGGEGRREGGKEGRMEGRAAVKLSDIMMGRLGRGRRGERRKGRYRRTTGGRIGAGRGESGWAARSANLKSKRKCRPVTEPKVEQADGETGATAKQQSAVTLEGA